MENRRAGRRGARRSADPREVAWCRFSTGVHTDHKPCHTIGAALTGRRRAALGNDLLGLADCFPRLTAAAFGRLLVVAGALHFSGEPLSLAESLEALEHLLDGFVSAWFDLDHERFNSSFRDTTADAIPDARPACGRWAWLRSSAGPSVAAPQAKGNPGAYPRHMPTATARGAPVHRHRPPDAGSVGVAMWPAV